MGKNREILGLLVIIGAILICFVISLRIGDIDISYSAIMNLLQGGTAENNSWSFIVENRLNRSIVALFAGGGLALAGLILQVFFNNPLAGPGVLGITSGATFGVAFVLLGGVGFVGVAGQIGIIAAGLIGSILLLLILLFISKYLPNMITLLVVGLMLSYFISAFTNILFLWADALETRAFVLWSLGSFEGMTNQNVFVFTSSLTILFAFSIVLIKPMNALVMGTEYAQSVGINLKQVKLIIIVITGLLASIVTVYCGPISFIGVAVPSIVRMIIKSKNHLVIIPHVILIGAALGLVSDIICRLFHNSIPLNTVTALLGSPIIIYTIIKVNKRYA